MTTRSFSAPGKLVVAGEYAVLFGHEALVSGVSRRATATIVDDGAPLTVTALGHVGARVTLGKDGRVVVESDADDDLRLVRSVVDAIVAHDGRALPTGNLTVDSSAFHDDSGHKFGLGSSAAVAVAIAAVLLDDDRDKQRIFEIALSGHKAFSHGRGSGIDVAASTLGGLTRFRSEHAGPQIGTAPGLPSSLTALAVFVGHSQNTREFIDAVNVLTDTHPHIATARTDALGYAAARVLHACTDDDADAFLRAIDNARACMGALGESAGIDIVSAPHQRIADIAHAASGAAKPSGAGGGDVALAFVHARDRDNFASRCVDEGFAIVDVTLGAPGVRRETHAH